MFASSNASRLPLYVPMAPKVRSPATRGATTSERSPTDFEKRSASG
jgi:hypothetical protein